MKAQIVGRTMLKSREKRSMHCTERREARDPIGVKKGETRKKLRKFDEVPETRYCSSRGNLEATWILEIITREKKEPKH